MFETEKSRQQARLVLQHSQEHTKETLKSLASRIETLFKTACSYKQRDIKIMMNVTFMRCLDTDLQKIALKKRANHKQTTKESEILFNSLDEKIDQMDLTWTITNKNERLDNIISINVKPQKELLKASLNQLLELLKN